MAVLQRMFWKPLDYRSVTVQASEKPLPKVKELDEGMSACLDVGRTGAICRTGRLLLTQEPQEYFLS